MSRGVSSQNNISEKDLVGVNEAINILGMVKYTFQGYVGAEVIKPVNDGKTLSEMLFSKRDLYNFVGSHGLELEDGDSAISLQTITKEYGEAFRDFISKMARRGNLRYGLYKKTWGSARFSKSDIELCHEICESGVDDWYDRAVIALLNKYKSIKPAVEKPAENESPDIVQKYEQMEFNIDESVSIDTAMSILDLSYSDFRKLLRESKIVPTDETKKLSIKYTRYNKKSLYEYIKLCGITLCKGDKLISKSCILSSFKKDSEKLYQGLFALTLHGVIHHIQYPFESGDTYHFSESDVLLCYDCYKEGKGWLMQAVSVLKNKYEELKVSENNTAEIRESVDEVVADEVVADEVVADEVVADNVGTDVVEEQKDEEFKGYTDSSSIRTISGYKSVAETSELLNISEDDVMQMIFNRLLEKTTIIDGIIYIDNTDILNVHYALSSSVTRLEASRILNIDFPFVNYLIENNILAESKVISGRVDSKSVENVRKEMAIKYNKGVEFWSESKIKSEFGNEFYKNFVTFTKENNISSVPMLAVSIIRKNYWKLADVTNYYYNVYAFDVDNWLNFKEVKDFLAINDTELDALERYGYIWHFMKDGVRYYSKSDILRKFDERGLHNYGLDEVWSYNKIVEKFGESVAKEVLDLSFVGDFSFMPFEEEELKDLYLFNALDVKNFVVHMYQQEDAIEFFKVRGVHSTDELSDRDSDNISESESTKLASPPATPEMKKPVEISSDPLLTSDASIKRSKKRDRNKPVARVIERNTEDRLLTRDEAAELLNVSVSTMHFFVDRGVLHEDVTSRSRNRERYSEKEIYAYIKKRGIDLDKDDVLWRKYNIENAFSAWFYENEVKDARKEGKIDFITYPEVSTNHYFFRCSDIVRLYCKIHNVTDENKIKQLIIQFRDNHQSTRDTYIRKPAYSSANNIVRSSIRNPFASLQNGSIDEDGLIKPTNTDFKPVTVAVTSVGSLVASQAKSQQLEETSVKVEEVPVQVSDAETTKKSFVPRSRVVGDKLTINAASKFLAVSRDTLISMLSSGLMDGFGLIRKSNGVVTHITLQGLKDYVAECGIHMDDDTVLVSRREITSKYGTAVYERVRREAVNYGTIEYAQYIDAQGNSTQYVFKQSDVDYFAKIVRAKDISKKKSVRKKITKKSLNDLLTTNEAAEILGISGATLVKYRNSGCIPFEHVNNTRYYYLRSDILNFAEQAGLPLGINDKLLDKDSILNSYNEKVFRYAVHNLDTADYSRVNSDFSNKFVYRESDIKKVALDLRKGVISV